ncbi:hypothetical protein BH18VER1_BH18VER1_04210 [soil metagenome]
MRSSFNEQFVRTLKSDEEARQQVDALAKQRVDAIKGVLEAGVPGYTFKRMDVGILRAVAEQAHVHHLPVAVHTGTAADVADAVGIGADSIEHGSFTEEIPEAVFTDIKLRGSAYNPTLSVARA